jgi:hypothetical protein
MARPAGRHAALAVRLAPTAGRRPVLASRLAGAPLQRDRGGDLQHRRLAGQLCRPGVPDAGPLPGAVAHVGRELGAFVAARGRTGPQPRRAARDRPFLRPTPARRGQRLGRRAADRLVRARVRAAGGLPGSGPGSVARGDRLPASGNHRPSAILRRGNGPGGRTPRPAGHGRRCVVRRARRRHRGRCRHAPADHRHPRSPVMGRRRCSERPRPRSAPGRGRRADLHPRPPGRTARDPRRPRGRGPRRGRCPGGDALRAAVGRRSRRERGTGQRRRAEPDAPPLAHRSGAVAAGCRRGGPGAAPDRRLSMAAGSPHPRRPRLVPVAGPVAIAVSGHVPGASRARHAVAPRAPGSAARRRSGRRGGAGIPDRATGPALARRSGVSTRT